MKILAPIDGSDCSVRALEFAIEFADRFDGSLHVVHFTDAETEATDQILERARETLEGAGVEDAPELLERDIEMRVATNVGKEILRTVDAGDYDHVVMGHHGAGAVQRLLLGSAAETVVRGETVPVTVVP
jgi:nucleotide-binding universal stress UspA family protein